MRPSAAARASAALAAGGGIFFVAAVWIARAIRPELLVDPEPSWAPARLALLLFAAAVPVAAGGAAAAAILVWSGRPSFDGRLEALPFSRRALVALTLAAVAAGAAARVAWIESVPWPMWVDDLSLIAPTRALTGTLADFADPVRAAPYGLPRSFGTVGVAYLELWRIALRELGVTIFSVRFPSIFGGIVSLGTAALLGRALLPRGGGTLAALILAGLRWSLILSRWGWQAVLLAPVVDLATLLLLRARRRGRKGWPIASAAGLVAGLGAHVYLSAWIGGAALALFAGWPVRGDRGRLLRMAAFALGFAAAAAPLVLVRAPGAPRYFARTSDHNMAMEVRRAGVRPLVSTAADALAAPWIVPDPTERHDIPGRSRIGWILGIPVAAILARALVFPRDELSGWLLAHAGCAFAAALAAGQATHPNGYRYGYLTTVAAVAAAGGVLWLLAEIPKRGRRPAALAAIGLLAAGGLVAARDALFVWGESRETYDGFHGQDTLIGRAAARWDRYGEVRVDPELGFDPRTHSPVTIAAVRANRLDPALDARFRAGDSNRRAFRVVRPSAPADPGERAVEHVRDRWGRERAVVYGRRIESPGSRTAA